MSQKHPKQEKDNQEDNQDEAIAAANYFASSENLEFQPASPAAGATIIEEGQRHEKSPSLPPVFDLSLYSNHPSNSNDDNISTSTLSDLSTPTTGTTGGAQQGPEAQQRRKSVVLHGQEEEHQLELVPKRSRSTVSCVNDETDRWGEDELASKEEHELVLKDSKLKDNLLSRLNTFRRNRELCDVVLFVEEKEILAHRVVIASISPSLLDLFMDEDVHQQPQQKVPLLKESTTITIAAPATATQQTNGGGGTSKRKLYEFAQGTSFCCVEALVQFAYTAKLVISSRKVADLYKTALSLQVSPVVSACGRYLANNLSVNNCIKIRKQANFSNDDYLVGKVDAFISANVERIISDSVEFNELPRIKVRIILPCVDPAGCEQVVGAHLAEKCLQYFQKMQRPAAEQRIDAIEALTAKSHLLHVMELEEWTLQDCSEVDSHSTLGACDIVQDYKRTSNQSRSKGPKTTNGSQKAQAVQHHVTGATSVKMNASRVPNTQYASNESLNSLSSSASTNANEIESRMVAATETSPGFLIAIAVLYRRLIVLSVQLSGNAEIARPTTTTDDSPSSAIPSPPFDSSSPTPLETHSVIYEQRIDAHSTVHTTHHKDEPSSVGGFEVNVKQPLDLPLNIRHTSSNGPKPNSSSLTPPVSASAAALPPPLSKRQPLPAMLQARCSIGASFLPGRIIIFGGYDRGECLKSSEEYDLEREEWCPLPEMLSERGRFDSGVLNGKVYAVGGSNGSVDLATCECYDPVERKWSSVKPLPSARSHNGCATLGGYIYCIGGTRDQAVLKDVDRYGGGEEGGADGEGEWEGVAPLQTARFQAGCTAWRGLVVCVGGSDRWACLDTVEAYDPKMNSWRQLPKLATPRRGCAVAVIHDSLYAIGGHDGQHSLSTVEVLDSPNAGHWRTGPSLTISRANTHAVVSAGNAIYVLGGYHGSQFLSSIEILESEGVGWRSWRQPPQTDTIIQEEEEGTASTGGCESRSASTATLTSGGNDSTVTLTSTFALCASTNNNE